MKADFIVHNLKQLVTCASGGKAKKGSQMQNAEIIENGAFAVKDGLIISVGDSEEILSQFESKKTLDAKQKVGCPAFVECHTHIVFAGDRFAEFELKIKGADYLELLQSGGGILSTVRQTREADLRELIEQSKNRLDKLLALGVTTCEIKTGYGLNFETELKMLEAIAELDKAHTVELIPTFLPAHAVPPEYFGKANQYVEIICTEMIPKAAEWFKNSHFTKKQTQHSSLITQHFFIDVFCEKNAFDLEQSRRVLETAKSHGFKIKAHVDEFTNLGGARMAIELGATSIDHLDTISAEEIKLLAASDTIGVVTPTVNFNFGSSDFADARQLIDNGCAIAVSTDYNPGSAPCPSLPTAMAIACRYQKILPAEAINAVTINAAFAVGLGKKLGSIEVGKSADFLVLDSSDYREVCYEFGGNLIESIYKNGQKC
ncbi:MAG: imidazolonepropionase [Pyrinomonadaceae bacterium]